MNTFYQSCRVGTRQWSAGSSSRKIARRHFVRRMRWLEGPFELRVAPNGDWSRPRLATETADRVLSLLDATEEGRRIIVRGSARDGAHLAFRRYIELDGPAVLQAGLEQLGVPYIWADANPVGPDGGPGSGFDCSGLTLWCYAQVGVFLPHLADAQMHDPQVLVFHSTDYLKAGDLIGYHVGRLPAGMYDHVGIADGRGGVVDASSSFDQVVHRPMNSNPIMAFGRIVSVNGPLG